MRRTDFDRLLASRPVNRMSAVVTSGGSLESSPPAPEAEPVLAPPPPQRPSVSTGEMLDRHRHALVRECNQLHRQITETKDKAARKALGKRITEVQRGLQNRPRAESPELQSVIARVAEEKLPPETWSAIVTEARRRLVLGG